LLLVGFGWLGSLLAVFIAMWVSRAVAVKLLEADHIKPLNE
jgi:hypothetical protein